MSNSTQVNTSVVLLVVTITVLMIVTVAMYASYCLLVVTGIHIMWGIHQAPVIRQTENKQREESLRVNKVISNTSYWFT